MAHPLIDSGKDRGRTTRLSTAFCTEMLGGLPPGLLSRLLTHPVFDPYREVVAGDTEFIHHPGELYHPVAVGYCELRSGRCGVLFSDEMGSEPPHAHGPDVLFVGFTGAEPEFYQSVGWGFDSAFLDLRVEGIHQTNIALPRGDPRRQRLPRSLIDFLRASGIKDGDAALKDAMRDRIIQGPPYTEKEIFEILKYCFSDVSLLIRLLDARLPCIPNFKQTLARGEYVKFTAEIFRRGQPADPWAAPLLRQREIRKAIRLRAVSDTSLTHGLYTGPTLKDAQVQEFVLRHGLTLRWRTTRSGKLGKAYRDFAALEAAYQKTDKFKGLADAHKTIKQLHELQLFTGSDGRYRTPIWAFSTITGRAAPNGSEFPFTTAAWCRFTLTPAPGTALIYLDFSSMEFGVAAALFRDPMMLADYAGEPYLTLPILVSLLPPDATRYTHGRDRDRYKAPTLSLQYGGGAALMAHKLGLTRSQGQRLVDLHHDRYSAYWRGSDRALQKAFDDGELIALDGWRCGVSSETSIFTARNWLIQANSAALFRYAGLLMQHLNLPVVAPVHDAVLLEVAEGEIEFQKKRAIDCLERASRRFLHGHTLRVDAKIIRAGERFTDPRGETTWAFVESALHELEEANLAEIA